MDDNDGWISAYHIPEKWWDVPGGDGLGPPCEVLLKSGKIVMARKMFFQGWRGDDGTRYGTDSDIYHTPWTYDRPEKWRLVTSS